MDPSLKFPQGLPDLDARFYFESLAVRDHGLVQGRMAGHCSGPSIQESDLQLQASHAVRMIQRKGLRIGVRRMRQEFMRIEGKKWSSRRLETCASISL